MNEETLAAAGPAELAYLLAALGLPVDELDVESLRRLIQRSAWNRGEQ